MPERIISEQGQSVVEALYFQNAERRVSVEYVLEISVSIFAYRVYYEMEHCRIAFGLESALPDTTKIAQSVQEKQYFNGEFVSRGDKKLSCHHFLILGET